MNLRSLPPFRFCTFVSRNLPQLSQIQRALAGSALLSITFVLFSVAPPLASAQTVKYDAAKNSVSFETVNVCTAGQTAPPPCSKTLALNYKVIEGGTLGTPRVVTTGLPDLDFTASGTPTCTGAVTTGSFCTVMVTFTPQLAGFREGAVQILDGSGNVLVTTFVHGTGAGPQIAFGPGVPTDVTPFNWLVPGGYFESGVAVDAGGDVYIGANCGPYEAVDFSTGIVAEQASNGGFYGIFYAANEETGVNSLALDGAGDVFVDGSLAILVDDFPTPVGLVEIPGGGGGASFPVSDQSLGGNLAADGAGDLFGEAGSIVELPADGDAPVTILNNGANGLAVDGEGSVFYTDSSSGQVIKLPAGSDTPHVIAAHFYQPGLLAVDGIDNIFVLDGHGCIVEAIAFSGEHLTLGCGFSYVGQIATDDGGNVYVTEYINQSNFNQGGSVIEIQRSLPPTLSFTATAVGTTSSPQSVQIENIGTTPLSITVLAVSANFVQVPGSGTLEDCAAGMSLVGDRVCNISIVFEPTEGGPTTGSVTLTDNALNAVSTTQTIPLVGQTTP